MQVRELGHAQPFTLSRGDRLSQRKRIHSFSTSSALACVALLVAGCAGGNDRTGPGAELQLTPDDESARLTPGATGTVSFTVTRDGVPIAGETVSFSITDPSGANGATLANSTAVSDASGKAVVTVRAALETSGFDIRAVCAGGSAAAYTLIAVVAGGVGTVTITPFFLPGGRAAARASTIAVFFYTGELPDGAPARCENLDPAVSPALVRQAVSVPPAGGIAQFDVVSTDAASNNAAVGRAFDARGGLLAVGCVNIPGLTLLSNAAVQAALPLADTVPDPVGTFSVQLPLDPPQPLAAAAALAAPWLDIGDCPLDPAQLWVDCTVDALATSADDPLDCVPASTAGAEGPLGDAIAALRGPVLIDATGAPTTCREVRASSGALSVDAMVASLFPSPVPPLIAALPTMGTEAAQLLDKVQLTSELDITRGSGAQSFVFTHTLLDAQLTVGDSTPVSVALDTLGSPVLSATASADIRGGWLFLDHHGFTLRLGAVARAAFSAIALQPLGLSGDARSLVNAISALAATPDGAHHACDALDVTLCPSLGQAAGCLATACGKGLDALASLLDHSFDVADGAGLDLQLSGSAALIDTRGIGMAGRFESEPGDPSHAATWSVALRTALDRTTFTTGFSADRVSMSAISGAGSN